jgi:hypothetical protein
MIQIISPSVPRTLYMTNALHRRLTMSPSLKLGLAALGLVAATGFAAAQMTPGDHSMHGQMGMMAGKGPMQDHHRMMQEMMHKGMKGMGQRGMMMPSGQPTMPGQDAFGTIQEIVGILEADANTNWSKVNISALREHLIDMNEVTLKAVASERELDNGIEMVVTGEGRTLDAIKRMLPAHARELTKTGWSATTEDLSNGVKFTVTSTDPQEVVRIKGLGFMGIMVQGGHHQLHHLAMARGEFGPHHR